MKKYLKDMSKEELEKIFENVEEFRKSTYDLVYENHMYWQGEYSDIFFGKDWHKYIEMNEYYSSFYLKLKDASNFFENISLSNSDYLCAEDAEKYKALYKEAKKYHDNMNSRCNYGSDKYYENEERLKASCIILLGLLEKELHNLEDITYEDCLEQFIIDVQDNNCFENCYIIDNNYNKVYEDIAYTKEYK